MVLKMCRVKASVVSAIRHVVENVPLTTQSSKTALVWLRPDRCSVIQSFEHCSIFQINPYIFASKTNMTGGYSEAKTYTATDNNMLARDLLRAAMFNKGLIDKEDIRTTIGF
ncbi:hypothetical protein CU097_006438 [Rhizopus azygosporus]|uniref:Uncharacterized protein n=1 Tax=Rhizopus azygosporus TaxID=86630 RepID=A0A367JZN0_RHIAZ|nr:hypothetical protein CU097_006438 [Rhizopus azygosporus]